MPDIAASDVSYTRVEGSQFACPSDPRASAVYEISFGDEALTYPDGGVPLLRGKLGAPESLQQLILVDDGAGDGYMYKFDKAAETVRIYHVGATPDDDPLTELAAGEDAPVAVTLIAKTMGW